MSDNSIEEFAREKGRSVFGEFFPRLIKEKPLGTVGAVITLGLLFAGVFADFLAPHGQNDINASDAYTPPSTEYWLGTDNLGRDLLSRIIYGARISLIIGLTGSTISSLISTSLGMLSGWFGGIFDLALQRFVDAWMALPGLILIMVMITLLGPSMWTVIIVLGIGDGIIVTRIIRGATMSVKENPYVTSAQAIGSSNARIIARHILPNIMAPVIILYTVTVPELIVVEASLSFLGFGIPPPAPSWGGMLSGSGRSYMFQAPWMALWPGLALTIVVYGVNMFGDAVRDLLDPRLRGGAGRF